jgi:predicted regulator of Ras-like GTPase activity (Roadblock/LC7/MglB family)
MAAQVALYDAEFQEIQAICERLHKEANAKAVILIDRNGQAISESGETQQLDVVSMCSLTASAVAATGAIAELLAEPEFSAQYQEGKSVHVHLSLHERLILVVLFDQRSSLGLVKLRVKRAQDELRRIFERLRTKVSEPAPSTPLSDITDDDIDALFKD